MTSHEMSARPRQMDAADMPSEPRHAASGRRNGDQERTRIVRRGSPGFGLLDGDEWERAVQHLNLSGREQEIARAIFDDRTESSIAEKLGISPHTVHTHVERLYRKLGVGSRTQLVLRVVQSGIGRDS